MSIAVALAHAPFVREVVLQLRIQPRLYGAIAPEVRAGFPASPRDGRLIFVASPRFIAAFRRWLWAEVAGEDAEVAALKRAMRASMRREKIAAIAAFAFAALMWVRGWRPW